MMRSALSLLLITAFASAPARSAEEVADYFSQDWYDVELIIFQRPGVMEFNTTERLVTTAPRPFPWTIRSFFTDPERIGAGYVLDAATMAALEPNFRTTRRPETFAVPDVDAPVNLLRLPERETPGGPRRREGVPPPAIRPELQANPLMDFLAAVAEFENRLAAASYRWAPTSEHVLQRSSSVLNRRFGHQTLLHGRWVQPVPARDAPEPMFFQTGPRVGDVHQLEGALSITRGRFLHFHAQLTYREPGLGLAPVALPLPAQPGAAPRITLPPEPPGYMVLDESRRMRSEEVHYLDHPKLGVIVRVDPVAIPEALRLQFEALKEGAQ